MADICGECLKIDYNNKEKWSSQDKYWCKERCCYVCPNDRGCRYYSYNRNHNQKDNGGYSPSGCPFSTILRDILGLGDNCEALALLRNFRENFLKKDESNIPMLLEYDQIGPLINESIKNDENRQKFSLEFVQNFIFPFTVAFKSGDMEDALATYKNMFGYLKTSFGFENVSVDLNQEYDMETLGKGRIRQLKTSEAY